jgi:hypothetical protein
VLEAETREMSVQVLQTIHEKNTSKFESQRNTANIVIFRFQLSDSLATRVGATYVLPYLALVLCLLTVVVIR